MKTAAIASPLIASENLESSIMGMDSAGISQATYFLRDKIYSNKILAVVREYLCNALDEHKKHGIETPVQVGFRSEGNDLVFFVRDFANGLSVHDVRNVFGMYFRSTKSKSNELIGGFGIGSKAGHCYTDTFFVTSFFENQKTTCTCMLGGDSGVPVGHIYEIGQCDTTEQGLEISMPINRADALEFEKEIEFFVAFSPAEIEFRKSNKTIFKKKDPAFSKSIDGFGVRLIEWVSGFSSSSHIDRYTMVNHALLQMGGVCYGSIGLDASVRVKPNHVLVVDIPVGMMSIPISRESFEDTTSNRKVCDQIRKILNDLVEEDLAQFKAKDVSQAVKEYLADPFSKMNYIGEIFSASKARIHNDYWPFLSNIRQSNVNGVLQDKKNKPVVVVIPANYAEKYWQRKTLDFSNSVNHNYYYINAPFVRVYPNTDLSDHFEFVAVKKLPFPKVARDSKRYAIYSNHGNCGTYSPLELHNYWRKLTNMPEAKTAQEASKQIKDYLSSASSVRDLQRYVIANRNHTSKNTNTITFYTSSEKFLQEMCKELGWVEYGSNEYKTLREGLLKKDKEKEEISSAISNSRRRWLDMNSRTRRLIEKNPKNALRIVKFWQNVRQESSFRAKMIKTLESAGYSCPVYTRSEFRSILKMK